MSSTRTGESSKSSDGAARRPSRCNCSCRGYIDNAEALGVTWLKDNLLNDKSWAIVYEGSTKQQDLVNGKPKLWYAWANPGEDGIVWFSDNPPQNVKDRARPETRNQYSVPWWQRTAEVIVTLVDVCIQACYIMAAPL